MITEHPLITAMKSAGAATKRQAESLLSPYYDPYSFDAAIRLAGALVEDQTGFTVVNDRQRSNDRDGSPELRLQARERADLRTTIATAIHNLSYERRDRLFRELAAGNGAIEARAMVDDIAEYGAALVAGYGELAQTARVAS